ncbi:MAG TPA: oligosaccharide flippase family protein [Rhizomicrobium sp.]|nr:oligosaccharide flippase family protein [Rhizomicrobium sp.]
MSSHHEHLHRGFKWLGGATIAAKIIDSVTILLVLLFLTKEQVGIASLVVSIGMVVEALDGLGTSEALVQARDVSRLQQDTLFWFILGAALIMSGLILAAAPGIEAIYGVAGMAVYFVAVAVKLPLVGAAVIPLANMNRELQYERIAIVNLCATLAAAITRLGLAIGGAGAWALVAGYSASGFYILVGAMLAKPFWPRLRFKMPAIVPLLQFGIRTATSNILEQLFKNVDYLLIGWFYGTSQLAIYRVAFDVAMEPAMAVGTLVNRVALPVFARVSAIKEQLMQSLTWSLRRLMVLVYPLMTAMILVATPLMQLIHDGQGHSYAAAALPLKILAAAAMLRVTAQLLYPLVIGSGRPGTAARLSAATLLMLSIGMLIVGLCFDAQTGIIAASAVWLGIYPLLLVWEARYVRHHWGIAVRELAGIMVVPAVAIGGLVILVEIARTIAGVIDPTIQIAIVGAATALTYAGLFLHAQQA